MPDLTFDDALRIARGCTDYCGGYHGKDYEIYQGGIQTVITALTSMKRKGLSDTQNCALYVMGKDSAHLEE
jgi:hypothetical protein